MGGAAPARGVSQPYQSNCTDQPNHSDQPNRPANFHNDNAVKHNSKPHSTYNRDSKKKHNNYRNNNDSKNKVVECYYCGKTGHVQPDCYRFLDSQKSQKVNKLSMESLDGNMKKIEVQFNMFNLEEVTENE